MPHVLYGMLRPYLISRALLLVHVIAEQLPLSRRAERQHDDKPAEHK